MESEVFPEDSFPCLWAFCEEESCSCFGFRGTASSYNLLGRIGIRLSGSVYTCSLSPIDMNDPTRVFVILSGEHPTLPIAEMSAILDANRIPFMIAGSFFKLVEIDADIHAVKTIADRGAFMDEVGEEIVHSGPTLEEIDDAVKSSNLPRFLQADESFSIRVLRFGGVSKEMPRVKLEGHLGWLMNKVTNAKVDLENPQRQFRGLLAGPYFHLGLIAHRRPDVFVADRRPRMRPSFHPSTMVPKLARSMVNMSHAVPGSTFLDPFCGVGGILLEASLLGCQVVGIDALKRMTRGSRRNLKDFLPDAHSILSKGQRAVVASPVSTKTPDVAESAGFKVVDRHEVYVHRSLTREILVLEAN